jgi:hypothetical protein
VSNKCPKCGAETVLLHEWREDVTHCVGCGATGATPARTSAMAWYRRASRGVPLQSPDLLSLAKMEGRASVARAQSKSRKRLGNVVWWVFIIIVVEVLQRGLRRGYSPAVSAAIFTGLVLAATFLALAVAAIYIRLTTRGRVDLWATELQGMVKRDELPLPKGPEDVGLFAESYSSYSFCPEAAQAAFTAYVEAARSFSPEHAASLTTAEMINLSFLTHLKGLCKRAQLAGWESIATTCRILGLTAFEPALWCLGQLTSVDAQGVEIPPHVRDAAREAAHAIRSRILAAASQNTLLRASTPADDTATLLRPASAGEEPTEQLLRRTDE